jgi:hypothetical protein
MKWRKINEREVKSAIDNPDISEDTIKGRKNALNHRRQTVKNNL